LSAQCFLHWCPCFLRVSFFYFFSCIFLGSFFCEPKKEKKTTLHDDTRNINRWFGFQAK
jgi:hypothetical protein